MRSEIVDWARCVCVCVCVCAEESMPGVCARVRSSVYIKRSHSMLCVTIIIIIIGSGGGWDAHFQISLSMYPYVVCLLHVPAPLAASRLCECPCASVCAMCFWRYCIVACSDLFIGSIVTIVTAFGSSSSLLMAMMMLPLQFPLHECSAATDSMEVRNVICSMRLTHPNVKPN